MKHIYKSAVSRLMKRIRSCGEAIGNATDEYTVLYWNKELALAQFKKHKIVKRLKLDHNVVKVDFINKKRVA
jgi:hypothetical protein